MRYLSVAEIAKKWNMSERSVRNYCAKGRVNGAFLTGKTWNLPENAEKPERINKRKEEPITLLDILKEQAGGMAVLIESFLKPILVAMPQIVSTTKDIQIGLKLVQAEK